MDGGDLFPNYMDTLLGDPSPKRVKSRNVEGVVIQYAIKDYELSAMVKRALTILENAGIISYYGYLNGKLYINIRKNGKIEGIEV